MKHLALVGEELLADAKVLFAERAERVRAEIGERSVQEYVAAKYGAYVATLVPPDLTLEEFLNGTSEYLLDGARDRARLCAKCKGDPAQCDSEYAALAAPKGKRPIWSERALRYERCKLFDEHVFRQWLKRAGVPMPEVRFENFIPSNKDQEHALTACREYAAGFEDMTGREVGLYLAGNGFGIGKTHLACAVVADLMRRQVVRKVMFAFVPDFLEQIRLSYSDDAHRERHLVSRAKTAELLVLDDLGAQKTTEWVQEQITIILNERWAKALPTIVTTNAMMTQITKSIGLRAVSRIHGSMLRRVRVTGTDRRRK